MNYSRLFALLLLILFSVTAALAEADSQTGQCPTVRVTGPDEVTAGNPLTFSANVTGGPREVTPTYNWAVSAGAISSGQGTSTITVDTTEAPPGSTITATVDLGGFDRSCYTSQSSTTSVMAKKADARKVAEYGKVKPNEEKAALGKYAAELAADPLAQAYIVAYPARQGGDKEMQAAVMKALEYLIKQKAIDASRVLNLAGAERDKLTIELWIAPMGANPPEVIAPVKPKPAKQQPKPTKTKPAKSKKS